MIKQYMRLDVQVTSQRCQEALQVPIGRVLRQKSGGATVILPHLRPARAPADLAQSARASNC